MKHPLLLIITVVVGFLGFMLGYAVPPFMEVGFAGEQQAAQQQQAAPQADQELLQHYKDLYKQDDE
ncbi:MAG: hypothetical protein P8130_03125 [Deltaproteobacteria bacterium]